MCTRYQGFLFAACRGALHLMLFWSSSSIRIRSIVIFGIFYAPASCIYTKATIANKPLKNIAETQKKPWSFWNGLAPWYSIEQSGSKTAPVPLTIEMHAHSERTNCGQLWAEGVSCLREVSLMAGLWDNLHSRTVVYNCSSNRQWRCTYRAHQLWALQAEGVSCLRAVSLMAGLWDNLHSKTVEQLT